MSQIGKGKLPFDNLPESAEDVKLFHDMPSPLLSGSTFVKKGKYTLVFEQKNAHVDKGQTGELVEK